MKTQQKFFKRGYTEFTQHLFPDKPRGTITTFVRFAPRRWLVCGKMSETAGDR